MKIRVEYDDGLPFAEHEIVQEHAAAWRALFGAVPAAHTEHSGTAADLAARRFADDLVKATRAAERNLEGTRSGARSGATPTGDPPAPPPEPMVPPLPSVASPPDPVVPPPSAITPTDPVIVEAGGSKRRTATRRWPWVLLGFAAAVVLVPLVLIAIAAGPFGWLALGFAVLMIFAAVHWFRESVVGEVVREIREYWAKKRRDRDRV